MRIPELLIERGDSLESLKSKVKDRIDATNDETLLHRIFTSLNSGTLLQRLQRGLAALSDQEVRTFINDISEAIVAAPGSYEEKLAFVDGLHTGFIDVDAMIDGRRHHFADLLRPNKKVPLKFLFSMFNALKDLGRRAQKGPGEFAIALMSPKVSVFGGGDLKIGPRLVEVKAEKGTIGATGYFQHSKVPVILQKYFPTIDLSKNIGAERLAFAIRNSDLDPAQLKEFADVLVDYIFKAQQGWADTAELKAAIANRASPTLAKDIAKGYLRASYSAYKGREGGKSKFDGIMIMDFDKQELRYFDDPEEMFNDIDTVQFNVHSKNKEWGSKAINPGVKLRSSPLEKPQAPAKNNPAALQSYITQQAEYLVRRAQQRYPSNLELRDPKFLQNVTKEITARAGIPAAKMHKEIMDLFPELKVRVAAEEPQQPVAQPPAAQPKMRRAPAPTR